MTSGSVRLGDVVQTRYEFSGFVQLNRVSDQKYLRDCRAAFLPTETETKIFRAVVRAARGNLDQGRRNLLLVSPFGTGKSLDLVRVYDIFTSKGNAAAVDGFDSSVRRDLLALTAQGPYLVVPVVGTESAIPLSQAILIAFRRAVEGHPFLKDAQKNGPFLVQVEYEQAALRLSRICDGELGHLRVPLEAFLRRHPAGHTPTSLKAALEDCDPEALEAWRGAFQAITGEPPSSFGVATPRDVFDRALPELQARGIVGIALLIDELSQYLRLYPQYEAEAIRTLDPLVHWIQEREPCFSIVATQAVPERLQEGATDADYQAWASLRGRFQVLHMGRQRYDALIAKALTRVKDPPTDVDKHPQMEELCQAHMMCFAPYGEDRATAHCAVASYYPFHPTVIAAIGAIADTLGQFERSIFQYLDRRTEGGFKDFIEAQPVYIGAADERLQLITLDEIFRYFATDWSKLEGVNDSLAQASRRAEAAVRDTLLARRVLDLVTLLAFVEASPGGVQRRATLPTPTPQGIATMLNVPLDKQLEEVLQRFAAEGYFTYDDTLGYRLVTAGGPRPTEVANAIQKHIAQDGQPVTGAVVRDYLTRYREMAGLLKHKAAPHFPIEDIYDVMVKNVKRTFTREFATVRQMVEMAGQLHPGETIAGRLVVGIVTAADNVDGKQYQQAVTAARKLAHAGAVVALVRQPLQLDKAVRGFRAAKAVAEDARLGTSETAKQTLEDAGHRLLGTLSTLYEADKLHWYTPVSPTTEVRFKDPFAAVEAAARKLTEKFPNGVALPDLVGGNSLKEVIRTLLDGGGLIELRGKPKDIFVSALQPLGVISVGPKTRDPKQLITVTEPDSTRPEFAASAEIWGRFGQALPAGEVVGGGKLSDALQIICRPPYWCPCDLVVYLLAAYMGRHGALVKQPYEAGFRKPSVDDVKTLVTGRSSLEVRIPRRTALSADQTLFVESLAKGVAATLPAGAAAYSAHSLDPQDPERGLAQVGEDLGRWYRDHGAYAADLIKRHCFGPDEARGFLKAVAEASEGGPERLKAPRLYTDTLPRTLPVPANQAPLMVEQVIEGLTDLAKAREEIDGAARLCATERSVAVAWGKFSADCLDRDSRQALLRALKVVKEKAAPLAPGSGPTWKTLRQPQPRPIGGSGQGGSADGVLTADELRSFANFVLAVARQVKSGAKTIRSLEDLMQEYRAARGEGVDRLGGGWT